MKDSIRTVIVDDEPLALDVLESHLSKLDRIELVARLNNAVDLFNLLEKDSVDLLFLDIQMPQLTGIEFLKTVKNRPLVILTTAYREYALDGYELDVVDYLLKPISFDRFLKSVNKVYARMPDSPAPPSSEVPGEAQPDFLFMKVDKKMVKIRFEDILYIESLKDYIRIRTKEKAITTYQRISHMEELLPSGRFMRIHRSFIVSLDKIDAFSTPQVEIGTHQIPIGRNYRSEVMERLSRQDWMGRS
ncbi:MAG: LytTR family DNA-binding domain-containing protein [Bacteroidota bacterium]